MREAYNRGTEALMREDYASAQQHLLEALAISPAETRGRIAYNLGNAYAREAQTRASAKEQQAALEQARHYYQLALKESPADADAKHNLEWVLAQAAQQAPAQSAETSEPAQSGQESEDPQGSDSSAQQSGEPSDAGESGETAQPSAEAGEAPQADDGSEQAPQAPSPKGAGEETEDGGGSGEDPSGGAQETVDREGQDTQNRSEASSADSSAPELEDVEQQLPGSRPDPGESDETLAEAQGTESAEAGEGEQADPEGAQPGVDVQAEPEQELPGEAAELDPEAEGETPAPQRRIELDPDSGELWLLDAMRESEKVYLRPLDSNRRPQSGGNNW